MLKLPNVWMHVPLWKSRYFLPSCCTVEASRLTLIGSTILLNSLLYVQTWYSMNKVEGYDLQMLGKETKLSCTFDHELLNMIVNTGIAIQEHHMSTTSEHLHSHGNYSALVSAGDGDPLCLIEKSVSFVNIALSDVIQMASGDYSMLALTKQGEVYGRGGNEYGVLATGDTKQRRKWTKIDGFPCAVKQMAYNSDHSLFLTVNGQVFSCGNNSAGQLVMDTCCTHQCIQGIGNKIDQSKLQRILKGKQGTKVVTMLGSNSSFVLCSGSELYAFGSNAEGRLVRKLVLLMSRD